MTARSVIAAGAGLPQPVAAPVAPVGTPAEDDPPAGVGDAGLSLVLPGCGEVTDTDGEGLGVGLVADGDGVRALRVLRRGAGVVGRILVGEGLCGVVTAGGAAGAGLEGATCAAVVLIGRTHR